MITWNKELLFNLAVPLGGGLVASAIAAPNLSKSRSWFVLERMEGVEARQAVIARLMEKAEGHFTAMYLSLLKGKA